MQGPSLSWWSQAASSGSRVALLARGLGLIGGCAAILMGFGGLFVDEPLCLIAAFVLLAVGVITLVFEGSFFFSFLNFAKRTADFSASRPYWQKAFLYCAIGVLPFLLCFWWHTFLAGGIVFASGVVYGVLAFNTRLETPKIINVHPPATPNPFTTPPPPTA